MAQISNIQLPSGTGYGIRAGAIPFGEVDSTSTSTAFTATVPGITELVDGTTVMLKNGVITSASGFTLNVNGLGAKPCYTNLAAATRETTIFNVAYTMLFVYDSTRVSDGAWICYRGYDANTNTIGYQLRTNNTVMNVSDTARYYKLYFTSANGTMWVPASVNSTNNATSKREVNQRPIDPFGRIVYTSANTSYTAGSNLAATTIWSQYTLVLGYSFNRTGAALTLTVEKPVYVKCAPQTDGSAIMDADEPIVQALPSTEDGKIYIYLGVAYDATHIELYETHPVYYYKDGAIRLWTNTPEANISAFESIAADDGNTIDASDTTALGISGTAGIETSVSNNGVIGIGHTNYVTAQNTQAVYPIKIDTEGHISAYGNAVTIPSTAADVGAVAATAVGAANGVAPLNSSSKIDSTYLPSYVDDVLEYSAKSSFPSTGETGKIYVDTSTNKTYRWGGSAYVEISPSQVVSAAQDLTSGTKVGSVTIDGTKTQFYAPTPPTIPSNTGSSTTGISIANHGTGTVIGVQSSTTTASKVTLGTAISIPNVTSVGSASTWTFEEKSIPNVTSAGSASTWTFEEKTIPNVTAAGSGSFAQGSFFGGSLTMTMDTTDTKKLNITFAQATHGADSHTHTAPTLGTAIKVQSKSGGANGTAPTLGTAIKVQSKSGGANGTAPTLGTAINIANVVDVDDVTVPIKNTSASTFVTGTTHTITDNGHTHSI